MPILPVRNLGGAGIITDLHPYDLPPNAISGGVNVRFENGKITRAPVMRRVFQFSDAHEPSYIFSIPSTASGADSLVTIADDFSSVKQVIGATETDLTPTGIIPFTSDVPFSHTFLGNVAYINRETHIPYQKRAADLIFKPLTAWNPSWRCRALRSYKDFLVALNVTKGATAYPTMVKWSDVSAFGAPPASWDETSTTGSAGENILNEMTTPIMDGLSLRDSFIIYGQTETWIMDYIGGNFLFRFRKLFSSSGVVNLNCVVQVDGLHYCFGEDDLYVHDGASKRSIAHGKVKDFVYSGLDHRYRNLCFTAHNPALNEIAFCYVAEDRFIGFRGATKGCNRAAIYNYRNDTWSFYDLPNVTGSTIAGITTGPSYSSIGTVTYDDMGGMYLSSNDDEAPHVIFSGRSDTSLGLSAPRLYGMDLVVGGTLAKPVDPEAVKPSFVERVGIDLDEEGDPLTSYKVIHALYPQISLASSELPEFQMGASDISGSSPVWTGLQPFDPEVDNKVDSRESGRYLGYRMHYTGTGDFALSGFDGKVVTRGRR